MAESRKDKELLRIYLRISSALSPLLIRIVSALYPDLIRFVSAFVPHLFLLILPANGRIVGTPALVGSRA